METLLHESSIWLLLSEEQLAPVTLSQCEAINICLLASKGYKCSSSYSYPKQIPHLHPNPSLDSKYRHLFNYLYLFVYLLDDWTAAAITSSVLFNLQNLHHQILAFLLHLLLFHTINTARSSEFTAFGYSWPWKASNSLFFLYSVQKWICLEGFQLKVYRSVDFLGYSLPGVLVFFEPTYWKSLYLFLMAADVWTHIAEMLWDHRFSRFNQSNSHRLVQKLENGKPRFQHEHLGAISKCSSAHYFLFFFYTIVASACPLKSLNLPCSPGMTDY